MTFSVSPGVYENEVDLTNIVVAASAAVGGFCGYFMWGPVELPVLNTSELDLVNNYLQPTNVAVQTDWLTAASYLAYSNALQVCRVYSSTALNATTSDSATAGGGGTGVLIKNASTYSSTTIPSTADWVARYCGSVGNGLRLYMVNSAQAFADLQYRAGLTVPYPSGTTQLDINIYQAMLNSIGRKGPTTTTYAARFNASNDMMHIFVVDYAGNFSGTPGTILETYLGLSQISGATDLDGNDIFYVDAINQKSSYVWFGQFPHAFNSSLVGQPVVPNANYFASGLAYLFDYVFAGGSDGSAVTDANYVAAHQFFTNKDTIDITFFFTGANDSTVVLDAIQNVAEVRKDCVVFCSPPMANVVGAADPLDGCIGYRDSSLVQGYTGGSNTLGGYSSSYSFLDCNWKYMYNRYTNSYVWIPCNGDTAGLCARTAQTKDLWWSPAGYNRGSLKNAIKLAWNPSEPQRDALYTANVNPIVSFPGFGPILFGDKTLLSSNSAFSRINVRFLFIVLETAIGIAAKFSLFEFNDQFTRAQFVSLIEPFLRDVQGRRGITAFQVVCDTTNNTPQVIDSNKFIGDIYIQPARSINYIKLNFVAVPTGVNFSTVVGQFGS